VELTFAPNFREAALAGKLAQAEIHLIRVQEARLPELDDAFVAAFGIREGGIEKFRADVRANLERELKGALSVRQKSETVDRLLAHFADIDVPVGMVQNEMRALLGQAQQRARQAGVAPPQDASLFAADAERRVRAYVLLNEIARQNAIQVDPQRVNELMASIASTYEEPEKVVELYMQDAELMNGLRNRVMEDQVVDWVLAHAKATDESLPFTQVMQPATRAG
jgi:trigger factor